MQDVLARFKANMRRMVGQTLPAPVLSMSNALPEPRATGRASVSLMTPSPLGPVPLSQWRVSRRRKTRFKSIMTAGTIRLVTFTWWAARWQAPSQDAAGQGRTPEAARPGVECRFTAPGAQRCLANQCSSIPLCHRSDLHYPFHLFFSWRSNTWLCLSICRQPDRGGAASPCQLRDGYGWRSGRSCYVFGVLPSNAILLAGAL